MTRGLFILSAVLLIGMILLFIIGFSSNSPALLIAGLFLTGPGFLFTLGMAIGRASAEVVILRRDETDYRSANHQRRSVVTRSRTQEPLS